MYCQFCNKPIKGERNTKKYCSDTCKQYAYLKRNVLSSNKVISNSNLNTPNEVKPIKFIYYHSKIRHKINAQFQKVNLEYFPKNPVTELTPEVFRVLSFIYTRILSIIDNLFLLSYKRKVPFSTYFTLLNALQIVLSSKEYAILPDTFPLDEDLMKLYDYLESICKELEQTKNKDGVKLVLSKSSVIRYAAISDLIGKSWDRKPFGVLFPEVCGRE